MDAGLYASLAGNVAQALGLAYLTVRRQQVGLGTVEAQALEGQRELIRVRDEQLEQRDRTIQELQVQLAALTTTVDVLIDLLVMRRLATREEILAKVDEATQVTAVRQEVKSRVEGMVRQRLAEERTA